MKGKTNIMQYKYTIMDYLEHFDHAFPLRLAISF